MTRQKLDGLIAQHFFGWHWDNIDFGWSNGHRGFLVPPEGHDKHKAEKEWEGQYLKSMPQYSTSPNFMSELQKKLSEQGATVESTSPRELSFEALALKGLRFRRKEIEALPRKDDTYVDEKNKKFYQVQMDQPMFRESGDGTIFGSWKKFED